MCVVAIAMVSGRMRFVFVALLVFTAVPLVNGQESSTDQRIRLLLYGELGDNSSLGYELPSSEIGPLLEIPLGTRFEVQPAVFYSPDKKTITNNGQSLMPQGTVIVFVNHTFGLTGGYERSWLWTSEFDKSATYPSAGVVLRSGSSNRGRTFLSYLFPTGCVWATRGNPCAIQSNRLQGKAANLFRVARHLGHWRRVYAGPSEALEVVLAHPAE